jgi:hypothetical protein
MALTTDILVQLTGRASSALDLKSVTADLVKNYRLALASGVAAAQADKIWEDQRTLAPSAVDSLDLSGGGLVDAFGAAFAPVKLKAILIYSALANLNDITLFGDTNHVPILGTAATTMGPLQPGCFFLMQWRALAGKAVTAGTGDIIKVTNAAGVNSVTYDIVLIGTSA